MNRTHWSSAFALVAALGGCQYATGDAPEDTASTGSASTAPGVTLLAIGTLSGAGGDRATATSAPLENGAAGNLLGGIGSAIAYAGGETFLAVPDRGPNATPYDSAVDDTTSFIDRVQTLRMRLVPDLRRGAHLPYSLTPTLVDTTLLSSADPLVYGTGEGLGVGNGAPALNTRHTHYFTGRSDNFDPASVSTSAKNARLDPEGLRLSRDREHFYVSDEYGPYVYEFDRESGKRTRVFALPPELAIRTLSPQGAVEIASNTSGRVTNKGMEGLAITPDGRTLVGAMQSPLLQDGGTDGRFTRIVTIDIASGAVHQHAYELTNIGTAAKPKYPTISEILAIDDHEFLVDERDGKGLGDGSSASSKKVYRIDLTRAAEVTGISGEANLAGKAVAKTLFLDVVATLEAAGIAATDIPAKLEGMALGPDVFVNGAFQHTLWISNDNDFIGHVVDSTHPAGIDNPNQFFVFAVPAALLPSSCGEGR